MVVVVLLAWMALVVWGPPPLWAAALWAVSLMLGWLRRREGLTLSLSRQIKSRNQRHTRGERRETVARAVFVKMLSKFRLLAPSWSVLFMRWGIVTIGVYVLSVWLHSHIMSGCGIVVKTGWRSSLVYKDGVFFDVRGRLPTGQVVTFVGDEVSMSKYERRALVTMSGKVSLNGPEVLTERVAGTKNRSLNAFTEEKGSSIGIRSPPRSAGVGWNWEMRDGYNTKRECIFLSKPALFAYVLGDLTGYMRRDIRRSWGSVQKCVTAIPGTCPQIGWDERVVRSILRARETLVQNVTQKLQKRWDRAKAGLFAGLFLGEDLVEDVVEERAKELGLAHVLVVSGYNLAVMLGFLEVMVKRMGFWGRLGARLLIVPVFIRFVGVSAPVLRALSAYVVASLLEGYGYMAHPRAAFALSIWVIISLQPYFIADLSMLLSILATIGVKFVAPWLKRNVESLIRAAVLKLGYVVDSLAGLGVRKFKGGRLNSDLRWQSSGFVGHKRRKFLLLWRERLVGNRWAGLRVILSLGDRLGNGLWEYFVSSLGASVMVYPLLLVVFGTEWRWRNLAFNVLVLPLIDVLTPLGYAWLWLGWVPGLGDVLLEVVGLGLEVFLDIVS